jgi:DNA modification methylase
MSESVTIGDATLYHADAADVLASIPKVCALVTDPPYGLKEAAGKNASRSKLAISADYGADSWDDETAPQWLMDAVIEKAKHAIIFGGNYYRLDPSSCWLVWDKENGLNDFADCELAWTNLRKAVRRIRYQWHGMLRANDEPRGEHPTQKPVQVMEWAIKQLPDGCTTILDPFMGSGTTGVAAIGLGFKFVGIEREAKYFEAARRRISTLQQRLFA